METDITLTYASIDEADDGYTGMCTFHISGDTPRDVMGAIAELELTVRDGYYLDLTDDESGGEVDSGPETPDVTPEDAVEDSDAPADEPTDSDDGEDELVCDNCWETFEDPTVYGGHTRWCGEERDGDSDGGEDDESAEGYKERPVTDRSLNVESRNLGEFGRADVHDDIWVTDDDLVRYVYDGKEMTLWPHSTDYRVLYLSALHQQWHGEGFSSRSIADEFDIPRQTVSPAYTMLRGLGVIERVGEELHPIEYRMTEAGWRYLDTHGVPEREAYVESDPHDELDVPDEYRAD